MQSLRQISFAGGFLPQRYCYLFTPGLAGLPVVPDSLIAILYMSIPITLLHLVCKRRDIPCSRAFLCLASFLVACGLYWPPESQAPLRQVLSLLAEKSG